MDTDFSIQCDDYENFMMTFDTRKCDELSNVEEVEALLLAQKHRELDVSKSSFAANFANY